MYFPQLVIERIKTHGIDQIKVGGDIGAAAITLSVIMDWAPAVAAVFTCLYAGFRLYEAVDRHFQQRYRDHRWPFKAAEEADINQVLPLLSVVKKET